MVLIMASEPIPTTIHDQSSNRSSNPTSIETSEKTKNVDEPGKDMIRSVSMSANIASSVWQEVNHLIHVNTGFSLDNNSRLRKESKTMTFAESPELDSVCSGILPAQDNVLLAMVLSRWDDIVGPQTMHMWLQKNVSNILDHTTENHLTHAEPQHNEYTRDLSSVIKAVHYVTCHTVNCTSVSATSGASSMFVVPDLNMVSIAHLFHLCGESISTPFSIAVIASFNQYAFLQQRYEVIQQWLKRFVQRLKPVLEKWQAAAEIDLSVEVGGWVLELNAAVTSTSLANLGTFHREQLCSKVLSHPALSHALTSHLQTFGYSVIIGAVAPEVNAVITFFSLFLEQQENYCSRLVPSSGQCCFNVGLYLQGLLLNGFGYREISSSELAANQYPVTTVDLTRGAEDGAVKQTLLYQQHIAFQHRDSLLWKGADTQTKSLLHPIKESAKLVSSLLKELLLLPVCHWKKHINNFKKKIVILAQMLISLAHQNNAIFGNCRTSFTFIQQFKKALGLGDADFLIILAEGEKIKPGLFCYVIGNTPS